jgi:hypothetical protein
MGAFTIQRPTARSIRFVVEIDREHKPEHSRTKLAGIYRELRNLIKKHGLHVARKPGSRVARRRRSRRPKR